jgi:fermentation-respiration switch protein FrsA (DUF1100 family)
MRQAGVAAAAAALLAAGCGSGGGTHPAPPVARTTRVTPPRPVSLQALLSARAAARGAERALRLAASRPYAIGTVTVRLTDPSRMIGNAPRAFDTIVRFPKPVAGQKPGPWPLIVFGHGFSVTPEPYAPLLDAWTQAGYVVAAPVFPLENANAPGGPDEKDMDNQPADMSLVISSLTTGTRGETGRLSALIDGRHIAVTGQSDGGDTALAAAYDPRHHDSRIGAAMILSGAEDPFAPQFAMPSSGPPLLAVQGTADTVNPPDMTYAFYNQAAPPKFLLRLIGASHQPPYTEPGAELTAVARTTTAFLDAMFKGQPAELKHLLAAGTAGDDSKLTGHQ